MLVISLGEIFTEGISRSKICKMLKVFDVYHIKKQLGRIVQSMDSGPRLAANLCVAL